MNCERGSAGRSAADHSRRAAQHTRKSKSSESRDPLWLDLLTAADWLTLARSSQLGLGKVLELEIF